MPKFLCALCVLLMCSPQPFLKPIMKQATSGLALASGEVINTHDQFEVFDDPRAVSLVCSRSS